MADDATGMRAMMQRLRRLDKGGMLTAEDHFTGHDETAAAYFHSGWDAAIREVELHRRYGQLDVFMETQLRSSNARD